MRHRIAISLFLTIAFASAVNAKDEGFAGKWVLDKTAQKTSDAPVDLETRIKQDSSSVTFESSFREPENGVVPLLYLGVMATKVKLSTDGQLQQNTIGPFQIGSKTNLQGNKMETEWTAAVNGDQVQGHWVHTLSDDGKHLTLEIKETSTQGQHGEATLNFVRK